jgi:enolase
MCAEVFHALKKVIASQGGSTACGDEGGFAPNLKKDEDALRLIVEAIEAAGYKPGVDLMIAIDPAVSEWYVEEEGGYYLLPKARKKMTPSRW